MIGIIGAMEDEVSLLKGALADIHAETTGVYEFYRGVLENKPVVLLRCGIGKVNAAVGCALLIDHYKPDLVINTGSAGGIDPGLSFGDAVIAEGLIYHDVDVTAFGYEPGQLPGMPAVFQTPEDLLRRGEAAVDGLKQEGLLPPDFTHRRGLIGSADVFMHETGRIDGLRKTFPAVKAVEMEGAAIAHACRLLGTPALIIRSLSDIAGSESPVKFEEFLPVAAKHSGTIVRRIVRDWQ
ncbi:MAG: 5'-methylthioadenosine/adenosylhomocysteine nucleosidase [Treponema sp.]|jgi:adenosylhomocysteine nucleosidase|nr:5'-methylthioadenosine/adenosylhomocysteine nucleosidase [Treponema sp.]